MDVVRKMFADVSVNVNFKDAIAGIKNSSEFVNIANMFGYNIVAQDIEAFLQTVPNNINNESVVYGRDWCYPGSNMDTTTE